MVLDLCLDLGKGQVLALGLEICDVVLGDEGEQGLVPVAGGGSSKGMMRKTQERVSGKQVSFNMEKPSSHSTGRKKTMSYDDKTHFLYCSRYASKGSKALSRRDLSSVLKACKEARKHNRPEEV